MTLLCVSDSWLCVAATSKIFLFRRTANEVEKTVRKIIDVTETANTLPIVRTTYENEDNVRTNKSESIEMCAAAISANQRHLAVAISPKICIIYSLDSLEVHRAFRVPKAPSVIRFDPQETHLVVGDRAGNVTMYGVETAIFAEDRLDINGEKTNFEGIPLTGGITMILDIDFGLNGRRLVTADRDEKIRISRYPQSYVIEAYGLSHEEYIKSLAVHKNFVISGGGDGRIHIHDLNSGDIIGISEQLRKDEPISRVQALQHEDSLEIWCSFDNEPTLDVIRFKDGFETIKSHAFDEALSGFYVDPKTRQIFVLTKSNGVLTFDGSSWNPVITDTTILDVIQAAKDPDIVYFKNVTHQNIEEYKKRKAKKFAEVDAKREKRLHTGDENASKGDLESLKTEFS